MRLCPDPIVMVEQRLNFSRWVKDGFDAGNAVIVADGTLRVVDMKYGTGIPVSAEGNSQMRLYALGVLDMFGELYDIESVMMTMQTLRSCSIVAHVHDELIIEADSRMCPLKPCVSRWAEHRREHKG